MPPFDRLPMLVAAAALYVAVTCYSLLQSSSPVQACVSTETSTAAEYGGRSRIDGSGNAAPCLYPLLSPNDNLSLDLWILSDATEEDDDDDDPHVKTNGNGDGVSEHEARLRRRRKPRYEWVPVESCRSFAVDQTKAKTLIENCTLTIPEFARRRNAKGARGGDNPILKAKVALRQIPPDTVEHDVGSGEIVAEAPLILTRIVERRADPSSSWWSDGDDPSADDVVRVPHFKYGAQAVVLRLVAEDRPYGHPPYRGDGTPMQPHPFHPGNYRPIFYVDDTALRHSSQIEMAPSGEGRPPTPLRIKVSVVSPLRDVVIWQVKVGMEMAESILHESELDEIRYLISDEHIYRFILTQVISFLHIWLDYLAFRDEVGFFVGRNDMGGVSLSSVVTRFCCSLIIFLYLLDGGGTSALILVSVGSGVAVEGWKAWKMLKPQFTPHFPFVAVRQASRLSGTEKRTQNYDRIATTYMGLILYPIVVGSSLYALQHYKYASLYSWLISNLANAVYTFGFIALCPQLYVNYRLKSVAHLPWKVFVYKLFNTFIDDAFAFLIESPLKHKIMTLRDDVVFIFFLVQAYIYRVDMSRSNEFGYAYGTVDADSGNKDTRHGNERSEAVKED